MKDLTVGNEGKLILQFATPMLLGNVFQQLYNIIDSIVVGNYIGKEALAAVGESFPLIFMLISFVIGIAGGSTIIISQYFGAKDLSSVRKTIDTMYIFLFFAAVVVSIIGITFSSSILRLINIPENILPQAKLYLNIYLSGIVFLFGFNGTSAILRGLGDSKTPLYFLVISIISNILLDLLFVIVFKWGIAGVAYATIISQAGAFFTTIYYLNRSHKIINLSWRKLDYDKNIFYKSLKIGLPSGLQNTFVALGMLALFGIVNQFGTNTAAAYSVAGRIDTFAVMPAMSFAAALSTFVGQNIGANKIERIRKGLISTLVMTTIISLISTAAAVFLGKPLMGFFTKDQNVIDIGASYLVIVSSFYIVFSSMFIVGSVLRGAGDTLIPMFITLIALWIIRIPASYYLSAKIGIVGIWWGVPAGWLIGLLLLIIYYLTGKWKTKGVIKYHENI